MTVRHDAKFSDPVLEIFRVLLADVDAPIVGPIVDPFAGVGRLQELGRADIYGIEIEPEWAALNDWVVHGDALNPLDYVSPVGSIITSPCYGNRFADQYLGPVCDRCSGTGMAPALARCDRCGGSGRDGRGRYSYALSLGRRVDPKSAASLQWGPKYQIFHERWLSTIGKLLEPGPRRLILNMSDHYRGGARQHVCSWWLSAAHRAGFRFVEAWPADTVRMAHGQNRERRAEHEMVFVFDFLSRAV